MSSLTVRDRNASFPVAAVVTSNPLRRRVDASSLSRCSSSSITSTLGLELITEC